MNMSRLFGLAILVAVLSGCATALSPDAQQAECSPPTTPRIIGYKLEIEDGLGDYVRRSIHSGQLLLIVIYRQEDMSGAFPVDGNGTLSIPFVGSVDVTGLAPVEVAEKLTDSLTNGGFLKDPSIAVVIEGGDVYMLGEVGRSGGVPYNDGITVLQAITKAGAFTYRANKYDISVQRGKCYFKVNMETPILPGDIINVTDRFF